MSTAINRREFVKAGVAAGLSAGVVRAAGAATDPEVIVIGAGLSGLNAMHLLEELGVRAICLEGRERPEDACSATPTWPATPNGAATPSSAPTPGCRTRPAAWTSR